MEKLKLKFEQIKTWIYAHPKKVYIYGMGFLILSAIFTIIQYFISPPEPIKVVAPEMYKIQPVDKEVANYNNKMQQMEKVVKELQMFKAKREKGILNKNDSVRIEFLIHQYNNLKNAK